MGSPNGNGKIGDDITNGVCEVHEAVDCKVGSCESGYYNEGKECKACTLCTGDQYETTACIGLTDRVCKACTLCSDDEYETIACSGTTNSACNACTTCTEDEYEFMEC